MVAVLCLLVLMGSMASADKYQIGGSDLIAGRGGPDVGDVNVGWDNASGELGVLITVDAGAFVGTLTIDNTQLYIGSALPVDKKARLSHSPGQFPFKHEVPNDIVGPGTDLYDFGEIGTYDNESIYVLVHANLTDDLGIDMDGDLDVDAADYALYPKYGAWANGTLLGSTPKGGTNGTGNWAMYFTVAVPELGEPAP